MSDIYVKTEDKSCLAPGLSSDFITPLIRIMNITEAIRIRKSVRNYSGMPLTAPQQSALQQSIDSAVNPFGGKAAVRLKKFDLNGPFKPSTYGTIRNATHYLLLSAGYDLTDALSAGYVMEQTILAATALGLGTCWIAATFKGTDFDKGEQWPEGQTLKAISPVGKAAEKETLRGKITKLIAGSSKRKPFESLFFLEKASTPLPMDNRYAEALEMMRLAPSSVNSQPWRAIVTGATVHFYSTSSKYLSMIDCGIGLCHFCLAEKKGGSTGVFRNDSAHPAADGLTYIISWQPQP